MIVGFNFFVDLFVNVILNINIISKVCVGVVINFICIVEVNLVVYIFLLYENGFVIRNMGILGIWIKIMKNVG